MHSFSDMARLLNISTVNLSRLQKRFELPAFDGQGYSDAYLVFLRKLTALRTFGVTEDMQLKLWLLEKKLMQLLHADPFHSPTWFLDCCTATSHPKQRLLLTNYDLGAPVPAKELQLGLNFNETAPELFGGQEMGEDALRVLNQYISLFAAVRSDLEKELPQVRTATKWVAHLGGVS
jgi:hypothetical protein